MTLLRIAARNLSRNKFRTCMTILAGAAAVLAFVILRTVLFAWNKGVDYAAKDRIATRNKVSFLVPVPQKYIDQIRALPGVQGSTYANWTGAKWPKDPKQFFAAMAVADNVFDIYPEIMVAPDQLARWREDKQGAIIGVALAKKLGLTVGDKVVLDGTLYPGRWEYTIDGIYRVAPQSGIDESSFYSHWQYLNDGASPAQKDRIGWIITRVDDARKSAGVISAIDDLFAQEEFQTTTMSERAMNQGFLGGASAILSALSAVSIIIVLLMMLILGNTTAMGVRERTVEYGVLRAIGFERSHIRVFVLAETLTIAAISAAAGLAVAIPIVEHGVGPWLEENMGSFFPHCRIEPVTVALAMAVTLGLAAFAALIPAIQAGRVEVTDALRRVA